MPSYLVGLEVSSLDGAFLKSHTFMYASSKESWTTAEKWLEMWLLIDLISTEILCGRQFLLLLSPSNWLLNMT